MAISFLSILDHDIIGLLERVGFLCYVRFKKSSKLIWNSFIESFTDWQELSAYYNVDLDRAITIANVKRTIPFGLFIIVSQFLNILVDTLMKSHLQYLSFYNFVSFFLIFISVIFIGMASLFLDQEKRPYSKMKQSYQLYLGFLVLGITAFVCLDILEQSSIHNIMIFYMLLCLGALLSLKEVLFYAIFPIVVPTIMVIIIGTPLPFIQHMVMLAFLAIIISQILYITYKREFRHRLELHQLNQKLIVKTETDALTGLLNRYGLQHQMDLLSQQKPCNLIAFLMIDVDFFKKYNDTFGHQQGDICLKQLATILKQSVKDSTTIVSRFGGEEFLIIIPNVTEETVLKLAQRILKAVSKSKIKAAETTISKYVTISMGISTVSIMDPCDWIYALKEADEELYHVKQHGRNAIGFRHKIYRNN